MFSCHGEGVYICDNLAPPPIQVHEDKQNNTALHIAARHGHDSVTNTLACNGANLMRRRAGGMLPGVVGKWGDEWGKHL